MSTIDQNLKYTESHEWVRQNNDGTVTVGISDHAQCLLGDLVYVELPEIGNQLNSGDELGVVESVKAASDVYAPISGEVTAINETLDSSPQAINDDAYQTGWVCKMKPSDTVELDKLLSAEAYRQLVAQ